jgi:fructose-bisphosphate aldolase class II
MNLLQAYRKADATQTALGHFNVSELVALKAVVAVAREMAVPVVVGVSESERAFIGVPLVVALVRSLREQYGTPIFLNADHTHSLAKAEEAARAGFDSVVFDASNLPFELNVAHTEQAVVATKSINPNFVVEGELGNIGSGSEIHATFEKLPMTTPAEARQFVDQTRVDVLSPAVGNMHGMVPSMLRGETRKHLDISRIAEIKDATKMPLTLHGASGTADADLRRAIQAGITLIHINSELRVAWRQGLEAELAAHPQEIAPYHLLSESSRRITDVLRNRLTLFSKTETARASTAAHPPQ